jgi:hypothetical protein
MFKVLDMHDDACSVVVFFYDCLMLTCCLTPLPLLDKEE